MERQSGHRKAAEVPFGLLLYLYSRGKNRVSRSGSPHRFRFRCGAGDNNSGARVCSGYRGGVRDNNRSRRCYRNSRGKHLRRNIFGGCDRFTVSNCWVYQCYDAGITHQYSSTGDCIMANVTYSANLVEDCIYGFEYFLALLDGSERMMRNVLYDRNIIRRSGYGWGSQRPSPEDNLQRHIMSWGSENPSENFVICNNVFDRCNSGGESLYIYAKKAEWQPVMFNNLSVR